MDIGGGRKRRRIGGVYTSALRQYGAWSALSRMRSNESGESSLPPRRWAGAAAPAALRWRQQRRHSEHGRHSNSIRNRTRLVTESLFVQSPSTFLKTETTLTTPTTPAYVPAFQRSSAGCQDWSRPRLPLDGLRLNLYSTSTCYYNTLVLS